MKNAKSIATRQRTGRPEIEGLYEVAGPDLFGYVILRSTGQPVRWFNGGTRRDLDRLGALLPQAVKAALRRDEYSLLLKFRRFVFQRLIPVRLDGQPVSANRELSYRPDGRLVEVTTQISEKTIKTLTGS